ncbi:MAG: rhomboid family intramembrane serine protease, partial [Candidatus Nanohaloarchaea archaeon]|nr:rhomboid family intramembrane serine protease [Candidatus Nanohaloarchaea archaeon]
PMPFRCKFCEDVFCSTHRLPENHDCEGLRDYTDRSRQEGKVGYDVMKDDTSERTVQVGTGNGGERIDIDDVLPASATMTVLGVMAAAFVLQYTVPGFFEAFVLPPDASAFTQPWRLVTSLFLHGGLAHLLVNSIVLWSFGRQLEDMLGVERFLALLFTAGIASSIALASFGAVFGPEIPALGISGGLLGLVAFLAVVRPDVTVLAFFVIPLRIRHALAGFAAIDVWNLAAQVIGVAGPYQLLFGPNLHIGSAGHLAGLAVGLAFGYAWRDRYRRRRPMSVWDMVQ